MDCSKIVSYFKLPASVCRRVAFIDQQS